MANRESKRAVVDAGSCGIKDLRLSEGRFSRAHNTAGERTEADGPSHFLLPDGRGARKPNGPTLLKRRLLAAAGWRVISVPFYEWDGFATANGQQTYLERAVAPLLG